MNGIHKNHEQTITAFLIQKKVFDTVKRNILHVDLASVEWKVRRCINRIHIAVVSEATFQLLTRVFQKGTSFH